MISGHQFLSFEEETEDWHRVRDVDAAHTGSENSVESGVGSEFEEANVAAAIVPKMMALTGNSCFLLTRPIHFEKGTPPSLAKDHQTLLKVVDVAIEAMRRVMMKIRIPMTVNGKELRASSISCATGCPPIGTARLSGATLQNM